MRSPYLSTIASSGETNAKEAIKTKYYDLITTELRKSTCQATIKQAIFVCELFSPFMHELQAEGPLIHTLYDQCTHLLLSIVECIIKKSKIPSNARDLATLNLRENILDIPKMSPSAKEAYDKLSSANKKSLREEFVKMFQTIGQYLQKNFEPFRSKLLRYLRVLDPSVQAEKSGKVTNDIVNAGKLLGQFTTTEIDSLSFQWDLVGGTEVAYNKKGRIDEYYASVLKQLERRHTSRNFKELKKFIYLTLCLPSSNAMVER